MTIELRAGKKYFSRDGRVYGPIFYDQVTGVFSLSSGNASAYWLKNGDYRWNSDHDLVSEYVDKSKFLAVGEKYQYGASGGYTLDAICVFASAERAVMLVYRNGYRNTENFFACVIPTSNEGGGFIHVESFDETKPQEDF